MMGYGMRSVFDW